MITLGNIQNFFDCKKSKNFIIICFYIFLIFAQNIHCGYTLEPPRRGGSEPPSRGGSNEYPQCMFWVIIRKLGIPLQTPLFYINVGFIGVYISRTCFPDVC